MSLDYGKPEEWRQVEGNEREGIEPMTKDSECYAGDKVEYLGNNCFSVHTSVKGQVRVTPPVVETTHSLTMEFVDGEVIEIPGPSGEGWKREVVFDEWTLRRSGQRPPTVDLYEDDSIRFNISFPSREIGAPDDRMVCPVIHGEGKILTYEYGVRIDDESPKLLSLTRYTRAVVVIVEKPNVYDAVDDYPMLFGGK